MVFLANLVAMVIQVKKVNEVTMVNPVQMLLVADVFDLLADDQAFRV